MAVHNQILTAGQMRDAERKLIAAGISETELMDRAGRGVAEWIWRMAAGRSVTVLCGPGNNGGDGYVIAATLHTRGLPVKVIAPFAPATPPAKAARDTYRGPLAEKFEPASGATFVDCLFGSGLSRPIDNVLADAAAQLRAVHDIGVAVDLPSGIAADMGELLNDVAPYDATFALGAWKPAHWTGPGQDRMGKLRLIDIGIEPADSGTELVGTPIIEPPATGAHKYSRGLVAVVAGAMPGAALLSAQGAMGAGAGYVKLLAEHSHPAAPADLVLDEQSLEEALSDERIGAVLIGPGLGRDRKARARLADALDSRHRLVIDADALHLLGPETLATIDPACILLTPHDGELAALAKAFGAKGDTRLERARALSQQTGAAVLAKGCGTVLCADGRTGLFPPGSSWLSVAGSGDVLAGICAARMAGGASAYRAASKAVYLHHEAAELAGPSFSSSRLAAHVRRAMKQFL
ncbi:ADP-dependent NAD(P)H-hydrate dehydratase [Alteripontixanthobacter maritimus]|uniref:Bifunctional NAD(P)H-hydrate repair enzyme n=2 Tax=Alteripontixanthobacter maritimus TaxID=2161824 RepID=A0A369Q6P8_9SPHN|nr:ADP-dependent NAD(P)H-hydrate dehydratase [Alteripontixanthobacter maritimus]